MIGIHLKTALSAIRRSPFQAFAALFVLALTFFVITNLVVVVYSTGRLVNYFETRPAVIAFLKSDASPEAVSALQNKLYGDARVKEVHYVSKEEALGIYKKATNENPLLSELVSPTIFPASLEFTLADLSVASTLVEEMKKETIVQDVGFTASVGAGSDLSDVIERIRKITGAIRIGGIIFASVLVATSLFVLLVIVGMRIATRKSEIEILSLIGATPGFIATPILLEAILYCVTGVFVGWILAFLTWLYTAPSLVAYFGEISIFPTGIWGLSGMFFALLAIELAIGTFLGSIGCIFTIARSKKAK